MTRRILSADPHAGYLAAAAAIDAAIHRVLASGTYILGPEVSAFEREFAAWLGAPDAVGVANGTDALELALRAAGIGPGDRVATVANSATATAAAIASTGAELVWIEIEPDTMLMDPVALEHTLAASGSPPVKAIVPVHLYGQPADLPAIVALARRHGALVIEDCAQAHGASIAGRRVGTWGALAAFSFYPTKNLAALGDGGAVTGSDPALIERVRRLRQYGWRTRHVADEPGRNSRLDEIQAAILRVRLPRLDAENARRSALADTYRAALGALPLRLPATAPDRTHVWHQFVVRTPDREALRTALAAHGIDAGVLYPVPLHRQPAYASDIALPQTEAACREVLSLPIHAALSDDDVATVIAAVKAALNP